MSWFSSPSESCQHFLRVCVVLQRFYSHFELSKLVRQRDRKRKIIEWYWKGFVVMSERRLWLVQKRFDYFPCQGFLWGLQQKHPVTRMFCSDMRCWICSGHPSVAVFVRNYDIYLNSPSVGLLDRGKAALLKKWHLCFSRTAYRIEQSQMKSLKS